MHACSATATHLDALRGRCEQKKQGLFGVVLWGLGLVVRIARPHIASDFGIAGARIAGQTAAGVRIAGISHRSILKNNPDCSHRRPTSQDFRRSIFSCIFLWFQIKRMCFRIASETNFFALLAIWGCAIRIASHIAVASRDLGH